MQVWFMKVLESSMTSAAFLALSVDSERQQPSLSASPWLCFGYSDSFRAFHFKYFLRRFAESTLNYVFVFYSEISSPSDRTSQS